MREKYIQSIQFHQHRFS